MKQAIVLSISLLLCAHLSAKGLNEHSLHQIQQVDLEGSFYEMGQQYVSQVNNKLLLQRALAKQDLFPQDPEQHKIFTQLVQKLIQQAKKRYPKEIYEFIQGEAENDFAKQNNLSLDDFIFLDQLIFVTKLASEFKNSDDNNMTDFCSFVGFKTPSILIGRNFDFPRDYLRVNTSYPIVVSLKSTNHDLYPNKVTATSSPGLISAATFVNDKGLYLSINSGNSVGLNNIVFQRESYLSSMLVALLKTSDFTGLKTWVMNTAPDFGYIVNIAGPGENELLSIEDSPYNELQGHYALDNLPPYVFSARIRESTSENTIEPEADYNVGFLVSTNTFRLLNWEPYLGHEFTQQTRTFSYQRYHNLTRLASQSVRTSSTDVRSLMEIELNTNQLPQGATVNYCGQDSFYSKDPSASYYSVVFDTKQKKLSVRYQQLEEEVSAQKNYEESCLAHWTKWQSFDVTVN